MTFSEIVPRRDRSAALIRRKAAATRQGPDRTAARAGAMTAVPPIVREVLNAPGQPLDAATRAFMEPRLSHDFSRVRVHTDAKAAGSAQAVLARSYTIGRNIVFASGEYAPGSERGRRLLAHELAHVVQQAGNGTPANLRIGAVNSAQEQEAERTAMRLSSGAEAAPSLPSPAGTIQREPPEWWRRFLENNRIDITVIAPGELPVVGTPRAGARRNPDGTWTVIVGNEEHTVGLDELDEILGSFGRGPGTPGGPTGVTPFPTPVTPLDPGHLVCPAGEYYDFLRRRCLPETPGGPGLILPELSLPELRLPTRPKFSLLNIESVTIDPFAVDSAAIPAEAEDELTRLVELLNAHPDADVRVDGHTDSTGTEEHNEALSEDRARAVRNELVRRGVVNPDRLRVRWFGERILLNEERTDGERAENRRVEVWFDLPPGETAERFRFPLPEGIAPLPLRLTPPRLLGD